MVGEVTEMCSAILAPYSVPEWSVGFHEFRLAVPKATISTVKAVRKVYLPDLQ
jgi:hypothetical protein